MVIYSRGFFLPNNPNKLPNRIHWKFTESSTDFHQNVMHGPFPNIIEIFRPQTDCPKYRQISESDQ